MDWGTGGGRGACVGLMGDFVLPGLMNRVEVVLRGREGVGDVRRRWAAIRNICVDGDQDGLGGTSSQLGVQSLKCPRAYMNKSISSWFWSWCLKKFPNLPV
jgi:hypothetical protein